LCRLDKGRTLQNETFSYAENISLILVDVLVEIAVIAQLSAVWPEKQFEM